MKHLRWPIFSALVLLLGLIISRNAHPTAVAARGGQTIYLPIITRPNQPIWQLIPFDANLDDINGPTSWAAQYGKRPEIIAAADGTAVYVLAQDYDSSTPWKAVLLRIEPIGNGYQVTQTFTDLPMLDRIMGLALDGTGAIYYATAVDEGALISPEYPPANTYRPDIVRVIKLNASGNILFNVDLDIARHQYSSNAEMIINPMVAATARLAVGGNEIALVHGINTGPDWNIGGTRHQKALSTRLNATTGAVTRVSSIWVSHSFDERLLYDGESISELHLGDAYPRTIAFGRDHESYPLFHIKGSLGANNTYTRLGNMALIEGDANYGYLALFASESTTAANNDLIGGPRNLAIVRVNKHDNSLDPSLPDELTVVSSGQTQTNRLKWLTAYDAQSNFHAERPKLIGIGGNEYLVLWEKWQANGNNEQFIGVYGMRIDAFGNVLQGETFLTMNHLHRGDDAILLDGRAAWVTGSSPQNALYIHLVDANLNYQMIHVD